MTKLADQLRTAGEWLIGIRDQATGGWGAYDGARVNSMNTAEAVLALLATGQCTAGHAIIQQAQQHLESRQAKQGEHLGAWTRDVRQPDGITTQLPDTIRTGLALQALSAAGVGTAQPAIRDGMAWLLKVRNPDYGWGYSPGRASQIYPTCVALQTMLGLVQAGATEADALKQTIAESLGAALGGYPGGSFGFPSQHGLEMVHTLALLKTMLLAQEQGVAVKRSAVDAARRWVRQSPAEATRWRNETIALTANANEDYTFTHVTPALYLEAMASDPPDTPSSQEALMVLADTRDEVSGAFSAKRPESWSTAKTLMGLAAVKGGVSEFPERSAPPVPQKQRTYLFYGILFLALVATVVNMFGKLSGEYIGLLSLIILALLLVYGALSEANFVELAKNLLPGGKKKEGG